VKHCLIKTIENLLHVFINGGIQQHQTDRTSLPQKKILKKSPHLCGLNSCVIVLGTNAGSGVISGCVGIIVGIQSAKTLEAAPLL